MGISTKVDWTCHLTEKQPLSDFLTWQSESKWKMHHLKTT